MENTNNEIVEKEKDTKKLVLFILKIVGNVVFYAVILMLLLFSIMNINAGSSGNNFPHIFGKGFLSVETNSMDGKTTEYKVDSFKAGDLVTVKVFKDKDCSKLKVGDVVTFYGDSLKALNTHRIVHISPNSESVITQGDKVYMTPALRYEEGNDQHNYYLESTGNLQVVTTKNIKGVVTGVKTGGGKVMDNIHKNWLWYFVVPVLILLLVEVFMVVKNIMDLKGAKDKAALANDKEAMMADLEAQKEEMRKQILAELAAQKAQLENEVKPEEKVEEVKEEAPTVEEKNEEVVAEPVEEVKEEVVEENATEDK